MKIKTIAAIALPLTLVVSAGGITYYFKEKKKNVKFSDKKIIIKETIQTGLNIFPKLDKEVIYEKIRVKNGSTYLGEEFIASVIQNIIKNIKVNINQVQWDYRYNSPNKKSLIFFFSTKRDSQLNSKKVYNININ